MNIDPAQFESEITVNDEHRREVSLASMKGKLSACQSLLNTAYEMAERASDSAKSGQYIDSYRFCEAVYASTEEMLASLKLVQLLSVKSSNRNNISELPKFKDSVDNIGRESN